MTRIYDCFLYHDERELVEIRLELLAGVVDFFVIVTASETFTGLRKSASFPAQNPTVLRYSDRIRVVHLNHLPGADTWSKENFSRNAISQGLGDARPSDWVMVSDVDELPRPTVLEQLKRQSEAPDAIVLDLEYYNFKFNYKLVHGLQAVWAGSVLCRFHAFTSAQELRNKRWMLLEGSNSCIEGAGWHFSFLTATADVSQKLASYPHQEISVQTRRHNIDSLIAAREGFHDHLHPASVWAVVPLSSFGCPDLERLVSRFPRLIVNETPDDSQVLNRAIRHSVRRSCNYERSKILVWYGWRELLTELSKRLKRRISGMFRLKP